MKKYQDETGLFEDFNFKLVVINSLLKQSPLFEGELKKMSELYVNNYEWYSDFEPIEEMLQYFSQLKLQDEDLAKVTTLYFDGGSNIYFHIQPDWDGEDDSFDVQSIKGFEVLKNLTSVSYASMCDEIILQPFIEKGIKIT
ncbi:hypothetical protein [Serratia sp. DD3]|uniref:DUF6892 domain-containing protein n=1 Tax=Serratia sp. DD3 TaxID=1410619 RepID=UPI0004D9487D|nr:hypothetical protein [Serratia sp. DD3]KEY58861.1 hypothetical protein SRDD_22510 [Serratia sp. DD3]